VAFKPVSLPQSNRPTTYLWIGMRENFTGMPHAAHEAALDFTSARNARADMVRACQSRRRARASPLGDMHVIMPRPSTDPLPPRWGSFFGAGLLLVTLF